MGIEFAIGVAGTDMNTLDFGVDGTLLKTDSLPILIAPGVPGMLRPSCAEGVLGTRNEGCAGVGGAPALAVAVAR